MAPLILVTNDDGFRSEGLEALVREIRTLGEVYIVAPHEERSAVSHGLTIHDPIRIRKMDDHVFAVRGTPADCVIIAVRKILPTRPDLVISGINHGGNVGDDIMYSGTVAAAREACYLDLPAFAISQLYQEHPPDISFAGRFACALAQRVLHRGLPRGTFLNVNIPASSCLGIKWTRQGNRLSKSRIAENLDPRGRRYYWIGEDRHSCDEDTRSNTDYEAVRDGYISLTPLQRDQTDYQVLEMMSKEEQPWEADSLLSERKAV